jgi:hypothetical protein
MIIAWYGFLIAFVVLLATAFLFDFAGVEDLERDARLSTPPAADVDGSAKLRSDGSIRIDGSADIDYAKFGIPFVLLAVSGLYLLGTWGSDARSDEFVYDPRVKGNELAQAKRVFLSTGDPQRWAVERMDVEQLWIGGIGVMDEVIEQILSLAPGMPDYCTDITASALYQCRALATSLREEYVHLEPVIRITGWTGTKSSRMLTEKMYSEVTEAVTLRDNICELYAKGRISHDHGDIIKHEIERTIQNIQALEELDEMPEIEAPKDDASRLIKRIREDQNHPLSRVITTEEGWVLLEEILVAHPDWPVPQGFNEVDDFYERYWAIHKPHRKHRDFAKHAAEGCRECQEFSEGQERAKAAKRKLEDLKSYAEFIEGIQKRSTDHVRVHDFGEVLQIDFDD